MSGRGPVVVVTGLPASGKSTLAASLRDRLGLTLLGLDTVKEAVVDGLGDQTPDDRFAVRRAAREVLVALAAANPRGAVVDVWVNPAHDDSRFAEGLRSATGARFVEVVCRVPLEVALDRYAARQRHHAHLSLSADNQAEQRMRDAAPLIGPLGLGPHVDVDTTTPVEGERLDALAAWVRETGEGVG